MDIMRNIYQLFILFLVVIVLTACGQQQKEKELTNDYETNVKDPDELIMDTVPEITFHAYLTDLAYGRNHEIPIFIVVHNDSNTTIKVLEDDFHIWEMEDGTRKFGQKAVNYEDDKSITIEPNSKGYMAAYFLNPSDTIKKGNIKPDYFQLEYSGELEKIQTEIDIEHLPSDYLAKADEHLVAAAQRPSVVDEVEEVQSEQSINGFIPEWNRFKVTVYQLEERRGRTVRAHIRVENQTDEEKTFDAEQVTLLDNMQEYSRANMRDSAFEPYKQVPAHGKVDYIDFFHLENSYDQSVEEIISQISGVRYKDDQFFEVIAIDGNYEEELPADFTEEDE